LQLQLQLLIGGPLSVSQFTAPAVMYPEQFHVLHVDPEMLL